LPELNQRIAQDVTVSEERNRCDEKSRRENTRCQAAGETFPKSCGLHALQKEFNSSRCNAGQMRARLAHNREQARGSSVYVYQRGLTNPIANLFAGLI
jgi:hypothetical protein